MSLSLGGKERVALCGKNASGKSTMFKTILSKEEILKTGNWHLPRHEHVGYLDQHYANLKPELSVIDHQNISDQIGLKLTLGVISMIFCSEEMRK